MFAGHKKHSLKFAVLVLLAINLSAWSSATAWDKCTVDLYYDLYQAVVDIRLLTSCEPSDFSPDDAYGFQESFAARFEDELVGYKLGLTWGTGFNATEPVYGRLFGSMLRENNAYIFGADVS